MPKIRARKLVAKILRNHNQYGVRQLGERDFRRARLMIRRFQSYATFDEMMPHLRRFGLHGLDPPLEHCYAVNISPKNRVAFSRTRNNDEVMLEFIGDYHRRKSRR